MNYTFPPDRAICARIDIETIGRIIIQDITPQIESGLYPVKRVLGESCTVEADVFRDGHETIRAVLKYRHARDCEFAEVPMTNLGNDRWRGAFIPVRLGRYFYTVEAWTDVFATWLSDFRKKTAAGRDVGSDLLEGLKLLERLKRSTTVSGDANLIGELMRRLRHDGADYDGSTAYNDALDFASRPDLVNAVDHTAERHGVTLYQPPLTLIADRPKARFSAWYEMFIRSQARDSSRSGTFRDAELILPEIADMGFDVLYLAPIHPIGITNRKGANNSVHAEEGAVGSPWAIGNRFGGHDAIDPALGNFDDFAHFVSVAKRLGLELALDFALQCSPDHPWVHDHPEWFQHRPDGTIKYAENPPKEYQDIYPLDFESPDRANLMREILRLLLFWFDRGVRIFRVDNPHTKPVLLWKWLIDEVQSRHPDILFLAEAFTRPKMMKVLAAVGFNQSYTYFTWRNSHAELVDYLVELTGTSMREYFRPNFFTNTPDILPPILQNGGLPAFKMRLVLAATLSSNYGIYSGFEFCEADALPGTEEYNDSEKYQIKVRDRSKASPLGEYIAKINRIRRTNTALQEFLNLRFLTTDNENILFYAKVSKGTNNVILIAVNLDPFHPHHCTAFVPPEVVGLLPQQSYAVTDLLTGASYTWSERNYIRLDPTIEPAHILRVDTPL